MKEKLFYLFLLFLVFSCQNEDKPAQTADLENTEAVEVQVQIEPFSFEKNGYFYLKGKINDNLFVTMHLVKKDSVLSGHYFYDKIGLPISIEGRVDGSGNFKITEYNSNYEESGKFIGRFTAQKELKGDWVHPKTKKKLPFELSSENQESTFEIKMSSHENRDCSNREKYLKKPREEFQSYFDTICSSLSVDLLTVKTDYPAVDKKINSKLLKIAGASDKDVSVQGMLNMLHTWVEEDGFYEGEQSFLVVSKEHEILTLESNNYMFTGGAHGMGSTAYYNFDLSTGNEIKINEILSKDFMKGIAKLAEKKLYAEYVDFEWFFEKGNFPMNDNFAITPGGLLFYFNSYELTNYAAGQQELFFTYKELEKYILKNGVLNRFLK